MSVGPFAARGGAGAPEGPRAAAPAGPSLNHSTRRARLTPDHLLLGGVVLAAWVLAAWLALSGRGDALDHGALLERSGLPLPQAVLAFLPAWLLMVAAMMLPSSLPMFHLFAHVSSGQSRPRLVLLVCLGAYLAIWTAFAVVAIVGDAGLHWLVSRSEALSARPWLISGFTLLVAGAFQFSPLKEQCLRACRHPGSFLMRHYRRGVGAAWALGVRHGLFCLGCCWALMLVMFGVGVGNLAGMALLTGVMLIEKTQPWGRRLVPAVGVTLLVWGALVLWQPAWLPGVLRGF